MAVLALYNPVGGDRTAETFFREHVLPYVAQHGRAIPETNVIATQSAEHAGKTVIEFLERSTADNGGDQDGGIVTVILGSGDGTLHEIISHLSLSGTLTLPPSRLHFALVPCGTANALYSSFFPPPPPPPPTETPATADPIAYKLQSVKAWLQGTRAVPLTLAITTLSSPPASKRPPRAAVSAVVTSTSLHAAILRDSEALRATIPGIERFKRAALDNITKWTAAWVKLLPLAEAGVVQIFNPATGKFETHPESSHPDGNGGGGDDGNDDDDEDDGDSIVDLDGPFAYFLSTVNVDRLEPQFVIAPAAVREPAREPAVDVVIVRPSRDGAIWDAETEEAEKRQLFAKRLEGVLMSAYKDGAHVGLKYGEEGTSGVLTTEGSGDYVVEYIRCGGWEWAPDSSDEDAHTLCVDGTIFQIEKEGRAVCTAARPTESAGFMVHIGADKILD